MLELTHLAKNKIGQIRRINQVRHIQGLRLAQVNQQWGSGINNTRKITLKYGLEATRDTKISTIRNKTYLQDNEQKFLINHTVNSGEIMTQNLIGGRSYIWSPIHSTRHAKMKIHGDWSTINLQGNRQAENRTSGQ